MKKVWILLAVWMIALSSQADEGMWLLPLLKQQKFEEMKALGLRLQASDIYSPDTVSLKDGVVKFGNGCSGELISPEGLLITNHHCGYSYIQAHSSLQHDYLSNGFWAMSRNEELPNPGLTVSFIDKIEDVTAYVHKALESDTDPNSTKFVDPTYLDSLAVQKAGKAFLQSHPGTEVEIKAFFGGNKYYMFTKKVYSDVRLVGAPPSSIGKFGADTDNWVWPRHTGDFSLFRIYADVHGNPAPYAKTNVPLRPKHYFKISLKGVNENDFAMILGFPGTTHKYYTSWEVAERRDIDNAIRIHIRNLRQQAMMQEMLSDPLVRIQYANKYAGSENAYKNAIGCSWAINKRDFETVKKADQDRLQAWALQNCRPDYTDAMLTLQQIVEDRKDLRLRYWMLDEALLRGIEFSHVPLPTADLLTALEKKDREAIRIQLNKLEKAYATFADKNYAPHVDRKIAKVMLREYMRMLPEGKSPAALQLVQQQFKGNTDRYVDYLFDTSIYGSHEKFARFLKKPSTKTISRDPMIAFARSVAAEKQRLKKELTDFDAAYAIAHRTYVQGLLDMYGEDNLFPDANLSLRYTYGHVEGYHPKDATYYMCQTTLDGVMQKEDSTNWEFVVPARLRELYREGDFGRYATSDGKMPVAFIASTHTTGGNSGSPVLNGNGELIGVNFDRNWEGVGGDIQYLPDYQRSIVLDIRYALFLIDKFAGAGYLLEEMELSE